MHGKILRRSYAYVILAILCTRAWGVVPTFQTFQHLLHAAPVIASGTINVENGTPVLYIKETLKGQASGRLIIRARSLGTIPRAEFRTGEVVLLFLEAPDPNGTAYLLGLGDQAKWPKMYTDPNRQVVYYPKPLRAASLDAIQELVQKILVIDNAPDLDQKAKLCGEYVRSQNPLLQYAAMEYAHGSWFWALGTELPHPVVPSDMVRKHYHVLWQLAGEALPLVDSNEPEIRAKVLRLLRYRRATEAMPYLIKGITDDAYPVREAARVVLGTVALKLKLKESFVDYNAREKPERLEPVQKQWNNWWQNNKARLKAIEDEQNKRAAETSK